MSDPPENSGASRRPLASRGSKPAQAATDLLLKTSITPNQISLASILIAAIGAMALWQSARSPWLLLVAACCVQLRLLCNLLDGLVAVEGARGTPVGALYNEIPDRIADSLFFVAWGYAAGIGWLGWATALVAAVTAYIRVLGGALGQPQDFRGPMAKQHRMALLTVACVLGFGEALWRPASLAIPAVLWIVAIGSVWTCFARSRAIAARLRAPSAPQ